MAGEAMTPSVIPSEASGYPRKRVLLLRPATKSRSLVAALLGMTGGVAALLGMTGRGRYSAKRSLTMNRVPRPGSLSAQIFPPNASTSRLLIARPRPAPSCWRVLAEPI